MKHSLLLTRPFCFGLLLIGMALISSCNNDDDNDAVPVPTDNIVDIIQDTEGLDSLAALIGQPGGNNTFANRLSSGEYTVFAPNNAAFAKLLGAIGLESMGQLRSSLVSDIILYHIVANKTLQTAQLDSTLTSISFEELKLSAEGDSVLVNRETQSARTTIVSANLLASNGVVHVVNEVLLPASVQSLRQNFGNILGLMATYRSPFGNGNTEYGGFVTMYNVFAQAQLLDVLRGNGPFTVLAPLDITFNNFVAGGELTYPQLGNYHILDGNINLAEAGRTISTRGGEQLYVTNFQNITYLNGIPAIDLGLSASNGSVLATFGVLKPADTIANSLLALEIQSGATFNIFKAALKESGVQVGNNRTIFVPTDQAFEAAGLVSSIDSASTARLDPAFLANIVQTHIINGINFSMDIGAAGTVEVEALNGTPLTASFNAETGAVTINSPGTTEATSTSGDELSTNGVLHVINKVLLPAAANP